MFNRNLIQLAVITTALLATATPSLHASTGPKTESCIFHMYEVRGVEPLRGEVSAGYGTYTTLRGAQLYIEAREGLTPEWLTLNIAKALAMNTLAGESQACRPAVSNVQVRVVSAGNGFWIQLSSKDASASKALLSWARAAQLVASPR